MGDPLTLLVISGTFVIALVALFRFEQMRGRRVADKARTYADRGVVYVAKRFDEELPNINNQFVREFFHYITNHVLTGFLQFVRRAEEYLYRMVRFNRIKATEARSVNESGGSHLTEIAEHKEQARLSESEKKKRREQALKGEI